MAYWLLKTEPSVYSFDDLLRDRRTCWDGINNPAALKHMRSATVGDRALVYHTGDEKSAIGVAEIVRAAYPDPQLDDPRRLVVDLTARERLPTPVTLATLKADPAFAGSPLVREGRLSFVPLTDPQWHRIEALSKAPPKAK
ncbi:MAG: EVE domain-containing protein [Myxococcales bacterium]|nr:EVE domain-containing protein [Myxococcales bacterium]